MTTTQTLTQTAAAPTLAAPSVVAGEPPWAALPVIIGGALMVILDFFILNVALPSLTTDLHASSAQAGVDSRQLRADGGDLPDHSRLAWRQPRSAPLYFDGVALFTLSSLACGLAPNATVLIVGASPRASPGRC